MNDVLGNELSVGDEILVVTYLRNQPWWYGLVTDLVAAQDGDAVRDLVTFRTTKESYVDPVNGLDLRTTDEHAAEITVEVARVIQVVAIGGNE